MAIQLKSPSLMGDFTHIYSEDSALDLKSKGFAKAYELFLETGAQPPLKNGEDPTVFTLRPVFDAELGAAIKSKSDSVEVWAVEMACYCIQSVKNLKNADGNDLELKFERVNSFNKLCREHRNLLGREVLQEIGFVCIKRQSPS